MGGINSISIIYQLNIIKINSYLKKTIIYNNKSIMNQSIEKYKIIFLSKKIKTN